MLTAIRVLALALTIGSSHAATLGGDHWVSDFDAAVKTARAENKDLLVDITGSDWCPWCIRLRTEVFEHEEFTTAVTKDYVLVELDFPRTEEVIAKVPNAKRNAEVRDKYQKAGLFDGYPTILLMTADGNVYAKTGYRPGGPAKYVEHLAKLRTNGRAALTLLGEYDKAPAAQKDAVWEKVIALFEAPEPDESSLKPLVPAVRDAFKNDPDNKKGYKLRAVTALLAIGEGDRELIDAARALDPKNERGLYERSVLAEFRAAENEEAAGAVLAKIDELDKVGGAKLKDVAFELYARAALFSSQALNDPAKAKGYALKAKAIGSDNEKIMAMLEKIANS
jgi:thioredoxin-related protein